MALTPQNNEAFFREVDEEVRRDRMLGFFARYGRLVAVLIVLALAALAGGLWWNSHRAWQAGLDSEALTPVLATMDNGAPPADPAALARIGQSPRPIYRGLAALSLAGGAAAKGDGPRAAGQFTAIAADATLPQPMRDLATIRAVTAQFDTLPPAQVIDRLKLLAVPGNAWFGSAAELTALAELKLGRKDQAARLFARIAGDTTVPASLRARAAGLATTLGQAITPAAQIAKG